MSDTESYGIRLEKKVDDIRQEVKLVSEGLVQIKTINEHQKAQSEENARKIEKLESGAQKTEGAITFLKFFGGFAIAGMITFCTWIVSNNQAMHQRISDTNQKVAVIESKIAFRGGQ
ncbi:hypothetical protein [Acinetobacter lactucae]|uniref:hypothetical protein n=1 Tax=Acinetobacter lactucae TaxID=1785128 RepID=UPI0003DF8801|nr:hypothetical protein [Acinetobacter lactucae]ETR94514.1 hypothetical protein M211_2174 [Acinetobacter lactucae]